MTTKIVNVAVGVIKKNNAIFICKRADEQHQGGLWEFPGGKIEKDETPEKALIRELQEELGISVWNSCLAPLTFASYDYTNFHLLMPLFICRKWEGIPVPKEGQNLKWVRPIDMKDYKMPIADSAIIPILRDWL